MDKIKYLILLCVSFVAFSCGDDDNGSNEYTNFTVLNGNYDKGTRLVYINDIQIPFETDFYPAYISSYTNKVLTAILGYSISDEDRDIFDRHVEFYNFRTDKYASTVYFDIRPNVSYSVLRGADIPQFIVDFYNNQNVKEMRNLNMQNINAEYNIAQKELTFTSKGTFVVSDGTVTNSTGRIEIIYKLKK